MKKIHIEFNNIRQIPQLFLSEYTEQSVPDSEVIHCSLTDLNVSFFNVALSDLFFFEI
jgi:hypothetical protein